ncbi:MAG: hypothetical protein MJ158_02710 [Alphaproteobacteria bacterium]|nr:hypothetical protein [Alphaproteobacteria bacterium]
MQDISSVNFVKIRLETPGDLIHTGKMDLSRPCIFILGGENTNTPIWANNYCITIAKTLYLNNITSGLDIYSLYYKFRDRNSSIDRLNMFREFRDIDSLQKYGKGVTPEDIASLNRSYPLCSEYPNYIYDIFNFAFIPRLLSPNDQMLTTQEAIANFRNMILYTHCHGTYVLRMLEKRMHQETNRYAYSLQDMYKIQKNLLAINHAPFAPLEDFKFTTVSFASAYDTQISYYNELDYRMKENIASENPKTIKTGFYGPDFGDIVFTDRIKINPIYEHSQVGLSGAPNDNHTLTNNGQVLFATERNALLAGTRAMLNHKSIPQMSELLTTEEISYKKLLKNAQQTYKTLGIKTR